jgi:H2-forming N5,N10-methylenetetrahydromethanopterin dehydrogenase-like enzyme
VAPQERRINQTELHFSTGRLPTGGFAVNHENAPPGASLVLAAVAVDILQNEISTSFQGHRVDCCADDAGGVRAGGVLWHRQFYGMA